VSRSFEPTRLAKLLEERYPAYLDDLRTLVDIDCGTFIKAGVNEVADFMQARFSAAGWEAERLRPTPTDPSLDLGDIVVGRLGGPGTRRVLLIGHMDTVFPEGTVTARPFRVEGSTAFGPGVSDMKSGLLAGLYASNCLHELGVGNWASITYVCNPDEELGSPGSKALIASLARDADVCFVLEGARENGDIVSARKGVADIRITATGRAAHAGVEPERGRSAILQIAHTVVALHALNGRWPGVTVNAGVINGGTRPNVVPERCELRVDVRSATAAEMEEALAEVERIARSVSVPDVTVDVHAEESFPPMEKTPATARLVEQAKAIAAELGFEVRDAATGGASDANPVAGMGVPTLDGLGPVGGADHAPGEWVDLESVVPRTALLASMIAGLGSD
jgi:glutamate carboxypeptidase